MNESMTRSTKRLIRVNGSGTIRANPDQSVITLGVTTEHTSLTKAEQENAARISAIIQGLYQTGIPQSHIQTSHFSIHPQYDYHDGVQIFKNYQVEHLLTITVQQVTQSGTIVDTAVQQGANLVQGITFSLSNETKYYQHALSLALQDAYEKANTITDTLQVHLQPVPLQITEESASVTPAVPFQTAAFAKSEAATTLEPGTTEITAQVEAIFTYNKIPKQ